AVRGQAANDGMIRRAQRPPVELVDSRAAQAAHALARRAAPLRPLGRRQHPFGPAERVYHHVLVRAIPMEDELPVVAADEHSLRVLRALVVAHRQIALQPELGPGLEQRLQFRLVARWCRVESQVRPVVDPRYPLWDVAFAAVTPARLEGK